MGKETGSCKPNAELETSLTTDTDVFLGSEDFAQLWLGRKEKKKEKLKRPKHSLAAVKTKKSISQSKLSQAGELFLF